VNFGAVKRRLHPDAQIRIAVYGSGGGSNAQAIINWFNGPKHNTRPATVALVVSNLPGAFILERARMAGIAAVALPTADDRTAERQLAMLHEHRIDLIALAGYLRKMPQGVLQAFPHRVVNIHPSLLPRFGGKGMHGLAVHQAVVHAGATETGITVHEVTPEYDEGPVLFQARMRIERHPRDESPLDDATWLQREVLQLEHQHYPAVLDTLAREILAGKR
jgi:phosphoribosylglycinamide formyltransferase-1